MSEVSAIAVPASLQTLFFLKMGSKGAAIATVIAQWISCIISIFMFIFTCQKQGYRASSDLHIESKEVKRFFSILLPIVMCTISWLFADNVYSIIYGNMGTLAYAAITILAPIQLLTVSMAAGLASSSGILIAKSIGDKKYDEAYCTGSIYTFHQARCSPATDETSLCCRS